MIILDTNVISEPTKPNANLNVVAWLNGQDIRTLYVTAISLAELMAGLAMLPAGKRQQALADALDRFLTKRVVTPMLSFDREAGMAYGVVVAHARARRYTLPMADGQIAAIAKVHGFAVATRDVAPFVAAGVDVINPWEDGG
ncbi:MAG TPA: type II toxin-antitoxin system VapC family toxin [Acidobacteriaceae bacterium]